MNRPIVRIDEEKCTGCGECIPSCAEGAIQLVDGKAKLLGELYCDGLGACLGECPEGAIQIEEREADAFDEEAVQEHLASLWAQGQAGGAAVATAAAGPSACPTPGATTCPSAQLLQISGGPSTMPSGGDGPALSHWPIKLRLVPPGAPFLEDADLMLVADCVPFASASLYRQYGPDSAVLIGCPKFDDYEFALDRLTAILRASQVRSLTVVHMEVPCCSGYWRLGQEALAAAGKAIPLDQVIIGIEGGVKAHTGESSG